jgi:hypothetical protein
MTIAKGLSALVLAGVLFYQSPIRASEKAERAIQARIEQLGDPDYRVREDAAKALLSMGADALPVLRNGRAHPDAEIRRRVEELIQKMERDVALAPRLITLHVTKKPVKEILAEVAKQTGYKIPTTGSQFNKDAAKGIYSFDFDKVRFWEALDRICDATGMVLQAGNDEVLRFAFQDNYVPYRSYDGIFKVTATGFNYYLNSNFGQLPRNPAQQAPQSYESLQGNFTVAVEPRMPILKVGMMRLLSAEDSEKNSMLLASPNGLNQPWMGRSYGNNARNYVQSTSVNLAWPAKSSRTIRVIKGVIPVTLLVEQKPVVVTDNLMAAPGKKFKVGTATFQVASINKRNGTQYEIKMDYSDENAEHNWDYSNIYSLQQRLELQDAKGVKCNSYINWTTFNSPTSAQFVLFSQHSNKAGPPAKLIYQVWVQMEQDVEFEFKDLPLP